MTPSEATASIERVYAVLALLPILYSVRKRKVEHHSVPNTSSTTKEAAEEKEDDNCTTNPGTACILLLLASELGAVHKLFTPTVKKMPRGNKAVVQDSGTIWMLIDAGLASWKVATDKVAVNNKVFTYVINFLSTPHVHAAVHGLIMIGALLALLYQVLLSKFLLERSQHIIARKLAMIALLFAPVIIFLVGRATLVGIVLAVCCGAWI